MPPRYIVSAAQGGSGGTVDLSPSLVWGLAGSAVVVHGSDAARARPATASPVIWYGSVAPTNADNSKDVWIPVASSVLFSDAFAGVDGAAWDGTKWQLGINPTTGTGATIQGNTGRLATGQTGSYNNPVDAIARVLIPSGGNPADFDLRFDFRLNGEVFPRLVFRSTSATNSSAQSYELALEDVPALTYVNNGTPVTVATSNASAIVDNTWYTLRLRAVGTSLQARIWAQGATEPSTWNINITNSSKTAAGFIGFFVNGGGAAASQFFHLDNVTLNEV